MQDILYKCKHIYIYRYTLQAQEVVARMYIYMTALYIILPSRRGGSKASSVSDWAWAGLRRAAAHLAGPEGRWQRS